MIRSASLSALVRGVIAASLLMAASAAPAQTDAPMYEVEVVVFRQAEPSGNDAELRPLDPPAPEAAQVVSLRGDTGGAPYAALASNELQLGGVVQGLRQSQFYEPLLHVGWRQPGLPANAAAAVAIPAQWQPWSSGETPPLYGLVRFYRERFLHVGVDLRYQPPGAEGPAAYVHKQSRRVKSGELHYLDHPVVGVLVQVRQVAASQ
jgi:hypothetical protein